MSAIRIVAAAMLFATLAGRGGIASADELKTYSVSVHSPAIASDDKVVAFDIAVESGAIDSISSIPVGWYVVIDNDASWHASGRANVTVGAAAMRGGDLQRVVVKLIKNEFDGQKFKLSGRLGLTKDFTSQTAVVLSETDFALK
jgi:hypothetical protein